MAEYRLFSLITYLTIYDVFLFVYCACNFMACVEDDLREREAEEYEKGLDGKVKLDLCRRFGGKREFRSICMAVVMRELDV